MGKNQRMRKIKNDPRAALRWLAENRNAAAYALAAREGWSKARADAYIAGLFRPDQRPLGVTERLKRMMLALPLLGRLMRP